MTFNLKIFLNILHFSDGPQDLPASANLLKIIILLNILIGMMVVDPNMDITEKIFYSLIYIFVTLLFIRVCLNIKDKNNKTSSYSPRYLQVCNATLGIHAIQALFINIVLMAGPSNESFKIIFSIISLYALFVYGHIFKNAFDTTLTIGVGISLLHGMVWLIFMMVLLFMMAVLRG